MAFGAKESESMSEGTYLNEDQSSSLTSRRKFLAGSAALAGGALMAVPGAASAHNPGNPPTDIDILNYALTRARACRRWPRASPNKFGEREFENANIFA